MLSELMSQNAPLFPIFADFFCVLSSRDLAKLGIFGSALKENVHHLYTQAEGEGFVPVFKKCVGIFEIFFWERMGPIAVLEIERVFICG